MSWHLLEQKGRYLPPPVFAPAGSAALQIGQVEGAEVSDIKCPI
jgi:hypothetical protein